VAEGRGEAFSATTQREEFLVKRLLRGVGAAGLALVAASSAWAQGPLATGSGYQPKNLGESVLSTLIFSLLGIVVAIAGFKLFDAAIPFSLEKEICEKNNIAVAILASAMILGICIIVAFVVVS
jgi:putative membrane protein